MSKQSFQPVYCRRCHLEIAGNARYCPTCGYDQRTPPSSVPPKPKPSAPPPPPATPAIYSYNMPELLRKELIRQWGVLNWYIISGLIFSVGVVGIALLVYAIIQQQAIRKQVAAAGDDPDEFARQAIQANAPFFIRLFSIFAITVAVLLLLVWALQFLPSPQPAPTPEPTPVRFIDMGSRF